ncbi:MAG: hypothetical protein V1875_06885 [Candidatus Altiarchaeota archaeon]
MAKKTTYDLARQVLKSLQDRPKSISDIKAEAETDWDSARKALEFLTSIGQVEEIQVDGNKRVFRSKVARPPELGTDTVFQLPITSKQDNLINCLFMHIRDGWVEKTGKRPNKTQVQKSLVDVVELCNLKKEVPSGWYYFGEMCIKHYDPERNYEYAPVPNLDSIDKCIAEVVGKKSQYLTTKDLRLNHYTEKNNPLYLTKEMLNLLPFMIFDEEGKSKLRALLTDFAMFFQKNDDNKEIVEVLNEFSSTMIYLIKTKKEEDLNQMRDELSESFNSVWQLLGSYNFYNSMYVGGWYDRQTLNPYVQPTLDALLQVARECVDELKDLRDPLTEPKGINIQDTLKSFRGMAKDSKELDPAGRKELAEKFVQSKSDVFGKYGLN